MKLIIVLKLHKKKLNGRKKKFEFISGVEIKNTLMKSRTS